MEYGFKWETTKYYGSINQWKFIRNKTVVDKQYQDNRGYLDNNKRKVTDVDIKNIPEKFQCSLDYISEAKKDRAQWGIYTINGNIIYMEDWRTIGDCTYDVFSHTGKILNDTTMIIPIQLDGKTLDTFRFVKFSPKPDSTNNFIK